MYANTYIYMYYKCVSKRGVRDGKFASGVCFAGLFRGMFRGSVSHSSSSSHSLNSRVCFVVCFEGLFRSMFRQSQTSQPYLKLHSPKKIQTLIKLYVSGIYVERHSRMFHGTGWNDPKPPKLRSTIPVGS